MELSHFIRVLRRNWVLIALIVLIGVALAGSYSLLQRATFQATTKVFISTTSSSVQDLSQGNTFVQQVVKSYADVTTTPYVLDPVIKELDLQTTAEALARSVSASAPLNTTIVEIDVTDHDPRRAAQIANAVSSSLSGVVGELVPQTGSESPVKITRVQSAVVPVRPISPNLPLNIVLGLVIGLALGVALAVLRETLDTRVRGERDVQALTTSPILGGITFDPKATERPLIAHIDPRDPRTESYRSLRTNLQFLDFDGGLRSIVVTSSLESEGKSTSLANLAITLSDAGERVVIVEADLRRPKLASYLGIDGTVGLTDLLVGREKLEVALQSWGDAGLAVLPAGSIPPNPSELLGSAAMARLLDTLGEQFTTILIDAPPLLPVTDAVILSKIASGAVVICAVGRTKRPQLSAALGSLDSAGARNLGLVLTMIPTKGPDSYLYGTYGYGAGYGYRAAEGIG